MQSVRSTNPGFVVTTAVFCGLIWSCGHRPATEFPPFPENRSLEVPDMGPDPVFYAFAADRNYQRQRGDWFMAAGQEGWIWLGIKPAEQAEFTPFEWSEVEPRTASTQSVLLPEGDFAWWMDLDRLEIIQQLRGSVEAGSQLLLSGLPTPDTADQAFDYSLFLAVYGAYQNWDLLNGAMCEGSLRNTDTAPVIDFRLELDQPISEVVWQEPWYPRGMMQGIAMHRVELSRDSLWSSLKTHMDGFGFDAPAAPSTDFAMELHFLQLSGQLGFVIAFPEDWAPREGFWLNPSENQLPLEAISELQGAFVGLLDLLPFQFKADGSSYAGFGSERFQEEFRQSLSRARPLPFAERRVQWPRGSVAGILDYKSLQQNLQGQMPISIPGFQNSSSALRDQFFHFIAGFEGNTLRLHLTTPDLSSGMDPRAGQLVDSFTGDIWDEFFDGAVSFLLELNSGELFRRD